MRQLCMKGGDTSPRRLIHSRTTLGRSDGAARAASGPYLGIGDFHPYALGRLRAERTGFDKMRGRGILWAGMQGIPLPIWL